MATRAKKVSGSWGIGKKRFDVCEALSTGHLAFPDADTPRRRYADRFPLAAVLVLAASLLLSACAAKDDPVIFGGAGGGNGGAGATSGVSVSW
jgi:hypothetical protein